MRWCWREGDGFSRFVFFRGRILPNLKCGGFINNQHEDLDRVGYISCINGGSLLMISTLWPSTGISPSWSCGRSRKFIGKVGHSEKRHLDCSRWCRYKRLVMLLLLYCCFYIAVLYPVNRWIFVMLDECFWQWPTSCLQNYRAADGLKNWTCYSLQNYLFGFWIACSIKVRCAETGGWLAYCVGKMWSPHGHEIHITVDGGNLPVFNQ